MSGPEGELLLPHSRPRSKPKACLVLLPAAAGGPTTSEHGPAGTQQQRHTGAACAGTQAAAQRQNQTDEEPMLATPRRRAWRWRPHPPPRRRLAHQQCMQGQQQRHACSLWPPPSKACAPSGCGDGIGGPGTKATSAGRQRSRPSRPSLVGFCCCRAHHPSRPLRPQLDCPTYIYEQAGRTLGAFRSSARPNACCRPAGQRSGQECRGR